MPYLLDDTELDGSLHTVLEEVLQSIASRHRRVFRISPRPRRKIISRKIIKGDGKRAAKAVKVDSADVR